MDKKELEIIKSSIAEEYRAAVTADAEKYTSARDKLKTATAESRKLLGKSVPLLNTTENKKVLDYITYVMQYKTNKSNAIFYSDLFTLGFIQGIRAERSRRNGTPIEQNERASVASYRGRKHKRRYPHTAS